jgi:regulatory protein
MRARAPLSLRAQAITWLAQREHSRSELRRKLLYKARAAAAQHDADAQRADEPSAAGHAQPDACALDVEPVVDQLLDWLEAHDYLSQARFVESRVHARAARFGNLRIGQELAEHGIELGLETAQALKQSELARAQLVWARKFGSPAVDAAARARQMRFLAGRGFSGEIIRRVVKGSSEA